MSAKRDTVCDLVAERVALGEPVGEAEHVAGCARCKRVVALATQLVATHAAVDPGLGFSARMTVGAQHQLVVRHRRRVISGVAAVLATGALGALLVTRSSDEPRLDAPAPPALSDRRDHRDDPIKPTIAPAKDEDKPDPWRDDNKPTPEVDDDVAALVRFADVDRELHLGASWSRIEAPVAPYRTLIRGVKP